MKKYNYRNKFTHQIQVNHTGEIHLKTYLTNKFNAKSKSIIAVHFKKGTGILPAHWSNSAETSHSGTPFTLLKVILTYNTYIMLLYVRTNM